MKEGENFPYTILSVVTSYLLTFICISETSTYIKDSLIKFYIYSGFYCLIFAFLSGLMALPKSPRKDIENQPAPQASTESYCEICRRDIPNRYFHFNESGRCICLYNILKSTIFYLLLAIISIYNLQDVIITYVKIFTHVVSPVKHAIQIFAICFYSKMVLRSIITFSQLFWLISFRPQVVSTKLFLGIQILSFSSNSSEGFKKNWADSIINSEDYIQYNDFMSKR